MLGRCGAQLLLAALSVGTTGRQLRGLPRPGVSRSQSAPEEELCGSWALVGCCGNPRCRFSHPEAAKAGFRQVRSLSAKQVRELEAYARDELRLRAALPGCERLLEPWPFPRVGQDWMAGRWGRSALFASLCISALGLATGAKRPDSAEAAAPWRVLDVAGGSGALARCLTERGVEVMVVDPKQPRESAMAARTHFRKRDQTWVTDGKYPWSRRLTTVSGSNPAHWHVHWKSSEGGISEQADGEFSYQQLQTTFDASSAEVVREGHPVDALLGLHPDEATNACLRTALAWRMPFAIVPCCVFARRFPRYLQGLHGGVVRTPPELVAWLALQAEQAGFQVSVHTMPFRGANRAVIAKPRE